VESDTEIWLKLEVLQPVRSFKIRGAGNAVLQASDEELADGVFTASAGNMAQGLAYAARLRGVPATIVAPEHAPQTKVTAIEPYGGGGLLSGVASAVKAERPDVRFYAAEPETGAPAAATFAAGGEPTEVEYAASWIDGSGSRALLPRVWAHVSELLDGAFAVALDDA